MKFTQEKIKLVPKSPILSCANVECDGIMHKGEGRGLLGYNAYGQEVRSGGLGTRSA